MKFQTSSITHVNQAKEMATKLLGITQDEHNVVIYKLGVDYLNHRRQYNQWASKKSFWNWFKLQYGILCIEAIAQSNCLVPERKLTTKNVRDFRRELHMSKRTLMNKYPPRRVIEEKRSLNKKRVKV